MSLMEQLLKFKVDDASDGGWGYLVPVDQSLDYKGFFLSLGIDEMTWEMGTGPLGFDTLRSLYGDRIYINDAEAVERLANNIANRLKWELK